jgi:hypothetical protein
MPAIPGRPHVMCTHQARVPRLNPSRDVTPPRAHRDSLIPSPANQPRPIDPLASGSTIPATARVRLILASTTGEND